MIYIYTIDAYTTHVLVYIDSQRNSWINTVVIFLRFHNLQLHTQWWMVIAEFVQGICHILSPIYMHLYIYWSRLIFFEYIYIYMWNCGLCRYTRMRTFITGNLNQYLRWQFNHPAHHLGQLWNIVIQIGLVFIGCDHETIHCYEYRISWLTCQSVGDSLRTTHDWGNFMGI